MTESKEEVRVIRKLLRVYQSAVRGRREMRKALRTARVRIATLEIRVEVIRGHKDDALAFIKKKGLFHEYFQNAGEWKEHVEGKAS